MRALAPWWGLRPRKENQNQRLRLQKKSKTGKQVEPEVVQVREDVSLTSNTQSNNQSAGLSLGSILNTGVNVAEGNMRPLPPGPIPRLPRSTFGDSVSERSEFDDEFYEESAEDVGRKERRRMFLSGLRNLVPDLVHPTNTQGMASGHFSLLQVKEKDDKMPFLNEVFTQVSQVQGWQNPANKSKRDFSKMIAKFYPTTEPAESTVFKPRSVPRALRQFVPQNALYQGGASGNTITLNRNSVEGMKEAAALKSQELSSSGIRLANNLEIGVEVCSNVIQQSRQSLELFKELDLPDSARLALSQLNSNMTVLTNTVYDMKSTSNDLLKVSAGHYQYSLDSRREAWVNTALIPPGIRNELKAGKHVKPTALDIHDQPLSMLAQDQVAILEDYQQLQRDQALLGRGLATNTFVQRPDRGRPTGRRGGRGQSFNYPQSYNYNQGQNFRGNSYRGRNPRGGYRGNTRGRGNRQPHTQPFSDATSGKKFE